MSLRDEVVAWGNPWGVTHERDIHYQQLRPIDGLGDPGHLPLHTDCSGFVTLCYDWAGVVDPNGNQYDGEGYTGTLLFLPRANSAAELQKADLIVYGPGNGDHVVMVVEPGPDPLCVSHGQEAGPILVRHSVEMKAHRPPATFLRGKGLDQQEDEVLDPKDPTVKAIIDALGRIDNALNDPQNGALPRIVEIETAVGHSIKRPDNTYDDEGIAGAVHQARVEIKALQSPKK